MFVNSRFINFNETYFILPRITINSYKYSQFFYNFRKQMLGLNVKTTSSFSVFSFNKSFYYFFDYFYYFSYLSLYVKEYSNFKFWAGVYNSVFLSSNTFLNVNRFIYLSNLFSFNTLINLFFFAKVFGCFYYFFLEFFFLDLQKFISAKLFLFYKFFNII